MYTQSIPSTGGLEGYTLHFSTYTKAKVGDIRVRPKGWTKVANQDLVWVTAFHGMLHPNFSDSSTHWRLHLHQERWLSREEWVMLPRDDPWTSVWPSGIDPRETRLRLPVDVCRIIDWSIDWRHSPSGDVTELRYIGDLIFPCIGESTFRYVAKDTFGFPFQVPSGRFDYNMSMMEADIRVAEGVVISDAITGLRHDGDPTELLDTLKRMADNPQRFRFSNIAIRDPMERQITEMDLDGACTSPPTATWNMAGCITGPSINEWGTQKVINHIQGKILWGVWPLTTKNMQIYERLIQQTPVPASLPSAVRALEGLQVFWMRDPDPESDVQDTFILPEDVIYMTLTFTESIYVERYLRDSRRSPLAMMRWGLDWATEALHARKDAARVGAEVDVLKKSLAGWMDISGPSELVTACKAMMEEVQSVFPDVHGR